jgi:hypothetical protein
MQVRSEASREQMWSSLVFRTTEPYLPLTYLWAVDLSFAKSRIRRLPVGEGAGVDSSASRTSAMERCFLPFTHRGTRRRLPQLSVDP